MIRDRWIRRKHTEKFVNSVDTLVEEDVHRVKRGRKPHREGADSIGKDGKQPRINIPMQFDMFLSTQNRAKALEIPHP